MQLVRRNSTAIVILSNFKNSSAIALTPARFQWQSAGALVACMARPSLGSAAHAAEAAEAAGRSKRLSTTASADETTEGGERGYRGLLVNLG